MNKNDYLNMCSFIYSKGLAYVTLPAGWRKATPGDFSDVNRLIQVSKPFLIHGYYSNLFECYRFSSATNMSNLLPFITDGRLYVKL
jgi:hypothetical protein